MIKGQANEKLFFLFSCITVPSVYCQNTIALPEIINYSKQLYKAGTQNWDICQSSNGLIYFANNEGLLSFDGNYWRLYPLPNKTIVRSLAIGTDGKIYVGGQDEIGYFSPDRSGELTYHSLTKLIPLAHRSFSDVWDIISKDNQLFFRSNQKIFYYNNDKITVYPADEWQFMGMSHKGVLAQDEYNNLLVFSKGIWTVAAKEALPQKSIISSSLPIAKDSTIITTLKDGIFLFTGSNCTKIISSALKDIAIKLYIMLQLLMRTILFWLHHLWVFYN